ncbi:LIM homeobox transcription factor 1-alpha [Blomia tropicalis]|nr:LIM homeobox transcription factor 1-alpha [Blomia tropicalis]
MDNNDTICQTSPTLINVEQLCELANPTKDELPNKSPKENICFNESLPSVLNEDSLIDDLLPLEWLYAVKCTNCTEPIGPHELVMRVQNYIFHVACFTCIRCGRQLQKGDEYSLRSGRLICRLDLETEGFLPYHPLQHRDVHSPLRPVIPMSPGIDMITSNGQTPLISDGGAMDPYSPRANNGSNCDSMINGTNGGGGLLVKGEPYSPQAGVVVSQQAISNGQHGGPQQQQQPQPGTPAQGPPITVKQDGRRGPKRPRTILTTAQRRAFKASFEISQKPCRKVRETLAKETGLSVRIVQVWFQNQRAKLKKMQRKQQQQAMVHGNNGGQGGGLLMGNGSESGGGMGSHSSDKSKDDSTDEEDDDGSTAAFSIPSMQGYMIHSPDEGAYYSREDDSGGYLTKGNELTTLDDSETSLCELDNDGSIIRPGSNDGIHSHHLSMHGSSMELTCLTSNGPIFHSPPPPPTHAQHHHSHPMMSHLGPMIPTGATLVPTSTQAAIPTGTGSSMTPIDKLYSMQNSYFNNPSECEC